MINNINFFKLPANIWAIIVAVCMLMTNILDYGTATCTQNIECIDTDKILLEKAMYSGQGITTDGNYYYTSGAMTALGMAGIAKWTLDFEMVDSNLFAIPQQYKDEHNSNHIGGISYYNGLIYASVENEDDDFPLVITYDCDNLQPVDVYEMPLEFLPDGIPWCAVDAENGYLYCSPFRNIENILAFNIETMEFDHMIELSEKITRIQGGEVYDGILYLSYDVSDSNDDIVLGVDVENGNVTTIAERSLPSIAGNEAEGLTVFPMDDGSILHILDYDKTVGIYIRHYKFTEENKSK